MSYLPMGLFSTRSRKPWGLTWRSSVWFTTSVVGFGITNDLLAYSIIIPVVPFHLERLKYHHVSPLTGWLLYAYSVGLVLSTIPISIFAEKSSSRRTPLVMGLLTLLGAQILFMEAPNYIILVIARVLQGVSSSMVWVVGLALLCDAAPEQNIVRQLGIAMSGMSIGLMVGPPAAGSLYSRFGIRAPFIFGEICTVADLALRSLVIERDVALRWGYDPAACQHINVAPSSQSMSPPSDAMTFSTSDRNPAQPQTTAVIDSNQNQSTLDPHVLSDSQVRKPLPILSVMRLLGKSPRAVVALILTLIYGIIDSVLEPTLPLHLQSEWGYGSSQVGLVYMASFVPAMISSPVSGFLADRMGSNVITSMCLLLALPWWIVLVLRKSVVLFIVALALQSFFVSGVIPQVSAELATVSRGMQGVGYAHVYGASNLAFGVGTAAGPVLGGQIYGRMKHGWTVLCCITTTLVVICNMLAFCYTGDDPLLSKMMRRQSWSQASLEMKPFKGEQATNDGEAPP